jgi:hypothetical protein
MSLRGTKTLFTDLFLPTLEPATKLRSGRNKDLCDKRNECLVERYYYHARIKHPDARYDILIKLLKDEFFLSDSTIPKILEQNTKHLHSLKKQQPSKSYFVKRWPHLVW